MSESENVSQAPLQAQQQLPADNRAQVMGEDLRLDHGTPEQRAAVISKHFGDLLKNAEGFSAATQAGETSTPGDVVKQPPRPTPEERHTN
jgi:hypothetical protein